MGLLAEGTAPSPGRGRKRRNLFPDAARGSGRRKHPRHRPTRLGGRKTHPRPGCPRGRTRTNRDRLAACTPHCPV